MQKCNLTPSLAVKAASLDFVAVLTWGDAMATGEPLDSLRLGVSGASSAESSFENPASAFFAVLEAGVLRDVLGPHFSFGSGRFLFFGSWG